MARVDDGVSAVLDLSELHVPVVCERAHVVGSSTSKGKQLVIVNRRVGMVLYKSSN